MTYRCESELDGVRCVRPDGHPGLSIGNGWHHDGQGTRWLDEYEDDETERR